MEKTPSKLDKLLNNDKGDYDQFPVWQRVASILLYGGLFIWFLTWIFS